ncbi:3-methyladenine DNA glycosylase [Subtercola endophyticus]|uniref:3-methyladenine DNA glycosylase n=1 Tax=Subtercola endophyticus TaxID=2895559 RepID=UPI001E333524|nr:3-methyladenine DNA glycosylase [Subtercola endophyticus]UFS60501.1 3-methyladenine DNA glycosylase [Subtercola endophyticus]
MEFERVPAAELPRVPVAEWRRAEEAHQRRADALTAGWRERRQTGETHAVDDFLFTYYPYKPSLLRRYHPGAGAVLEHGAEAERSGYKWYAEDSHGGSFVDSAALLAARGATFGFIERLLGATAARPAQFGCFGLHEWAMVYRVKEGEVRHESIPLRLSAAETDQVVETNHIVCTHFDAFRFFTPEAVGLNSGRPSRENQEHTEQAGCLHAGMDVYKWAIKLGPVVPGELLLDAFELARDIRQLDMQASPYDVSSFGLEPVRIETREGKVEYAARQRVFAERSNALRERMLGAITLARAAASRVGPVALETRISAA